jgi:2-oxoglutarate ferredoxin oxidoreductase subunit alpha
VFVQAESEIAAINMVYGAACAGVRTMTSTSGPGFSLMQEGISYIVCSEVPAVIVNVMRGGPGLGNIQPAQGDYFQMVKGGGHGDYHPIVLAPDTLQEAVDLCVLAFDLAEKYRTVAMVIADGMIGQMMEPVKLPPFREKESVEPEYALRGCKGREKRVITSLYLGGPRLEAVNNRLQARLRAIRVSEQRWESTSCDDADVVVVAFGTAARIARTAIRRARERGVRAGLFRPITVYPFPAGPLAEAAAGRTLLVFELNAGQMLEDVRLAVGDHVPMRFLGRTGGVVPLPEDILDELLTMGPGRHRKLSLQERDSEPV